MGTWRTLRLRPALVLGLFALTSGVADGADRPRGPKRYDIETLDADALEEAVRDGTSYTMYVLGRRLELLLSPSTLRSDRFRVVRGGLQSERLAFAAPPRTFKGKVAGEEESLVRLSTGPLGIRGCIKTPDGWTFIEPLKTGEVQIDSAHMIFSDAELDPEFLGTCAAHVQLPVADTESVGTAESAAQDADSAPVVVDSDNPQDYEINVFPHEHAGAEAAGQLRTLELAIDADVEYFNRYGENAQAEIESVMNVVDGIFQVELDLTIELVMVRIWDAEPDPYDSTSSNTVLQEVRNYWNSNHNAVVRDGVHLFTGKNLDGSTVGIAYVGVVCSRSVAYALSQDLASEALMPILVAHEMGHNLGANHDAIDSTPRYVMYPSLGITNLDEFSTGSESEVADFVDGVSCLALADDDGGSGTGGTGGTGGDDGGDDGGGNTGGGGGGGGGPVDPFLLALAGGAAIAQRLAARKQRHPGTSLPH